MDQPPFKIKVKEIVYKENKDENLYIEILAKYTQCQEIDKSNQNIYIYIYVYNALI